MKKAQGLSINAIIVAAIALIVLVVLVAIFTGRLGTWGKGVTTAAENECEGPNINGDCVPATEGCTGANTVRSYGAKCASSSDVCCVARGAEE